MSEGFSLVAPFSGGAIAHKLAERNPSMRAMSKLFGAAYTHLNHHCEASFLVFRFSAFGAVAGLAVGCGFLAS
jgi:hypothetical protein